MTESMNAYMRTGGERQLTTSSPEALLSALVIEDMMFNRLVDAYKDKMHCLCRDVCRMLEAGIKGVQT